ncbi:hypothetical protein C8N37_104149 [Sphingobacterium faecium]|nr:hypothetical protein C8N37_104149 [Sphingobacterium faecium]
MNKFQGIKNPLFYFKRRDACFFYQGLYNLFNSKLYYLKFILN